MYESEVFFISSLPRLGESIVAPPLKSLHLPSPFLQNQALNFAPSKLLHYFLTHLLDI